jgi:archaellum component FlaG (FlaF/FlaG flagellin family)
MSIVWNTGAAAMRFRLKNKKKKGIIMENKTIQVTVMGGVVVDVKNLPEGWDLQIIDKDNEEN